MLKTPKVISDILLTEVQSAKKRKEYGFGNNKHGKKESRAEIFELMRQLSERLVHSSKMDLEVFGEEYLPEKGPVLYVATHKSVFDIVVLMTLLKEPAIFIGKKEVSSMPFVNKWFDALGCIYVDRNDMRQALKSIMEGVKDIKNGQSIVLFPEGTRNMSNDIKPFKEGGFKLATKTGVPVVPIALSNTFKVFEEKKFIQKTKIKVNIGKPIETKDLSKEELTQLPQLVEDTIRTLMIEITD